MRAVLLLSFVVVAELAASCLNTSAEEVKADGIKSRPAAINAYRPKHGCFATGTLDSAGRVQVVCR